MCRWNFMQRTARRYRQAAPGAELPPPTTGPCGWRSRCFLCYLYYHSRFISISFRSATGRSGNIGWAAV